jgi:Xaa-Pro aminopeptidase
MKRRSVIALSAALWALSVSGYGQEGFSLFTTDFPAEEFAARRAAIQKAIGANGVALLQGAPSPPGYTRFRQSNEFYYVSGIEVPHAYIVIEGGGRSTLYLPHRNERREGSEGKLFSAEDSVEVQRVSGIDAVAGLDMLPEHLARLARGQGRSLFTPMSPAEGFAMSRDLATRAVADRAADPFDGAPSREGVFAQTLRTRFPQFEMRDLSPILDQLRLIKSPRELTLIRKATQLAGLALMEAMRSTKPGLYEYELDAMAKYVFYRNGAQGEAYYSLIASATNAWYPHYNAGKRRMQDGDFLLMDFAPDVGYYMSDVTRMMPVNGTFSPWQRELYGFYAGAYKAVLDAIRPNVTPQAIIQDAVKQMDRLLASSTFSKPSYQAAAQEFVGNYRRSANNPRASLGHWVGMATHDVGTNDGPLRPGMVFTIEPALRVPDEKIYIRLEDLIIITDTGKDVVSDFVPTEIGAIEALMKEEGLLQRYGKDRPPPEAAQEDAALARRSHSWLQHARRSEAEPR